MLFLVSRYYIVKKNAFLFFSFFPFHFSWFFFKLLHHHHYHCLKQLQLLHHTIAFPSRTLISSPLLSSDLMLVSNSLNFRNCLGAAVSGLGLLAERCWRCGGIWAIGKRVSFDDRHRTIIIFSFLMPNWLLIISRAFLPPRFFRFGLALESRMICSLVHLVYQTQRTSTQPSQQFTEKMNWNETYNNSVCHSIRYAFNPEQIMCWWKRRSVRLTFF